MTGNQPSSRSPRLTFPSRMRLRATKDFPVLYKSAARINLGPVMVYGRPNRLGHSRLGLSVPRRVGTAVNRNRIKRLLREAFRLGQHDWPAGYDVVVSVKPHAPMALIEYRSTLARALQAIHQTWTRKADKTKPPQ